MVASNSSSLIVLILFTKVSRNFGEPNQSEKIPLILKTFLSFDILFETGGEVCFPQFCQNM